MRRLLLVVLSVGFLSSCLGQLYPSHQVATSVSSRMFDGIESFPDRDICIGALTEKSETLGWERRDLYSRQVREAKRRGLSLQRCAELTGRETEARRLAEEERQRQEAEAQRLAEEERKRQETEARRLAEEERKRQEAEARRLAEEERKRQEAEARRLAEEERQRQEAEARRLAEEERQRQEAEFMAMAVQKRLADLGYDPGPADGVVDQKTRAAIKAFQHLAGLPTTGEVSEGLLEKINEQVQVAEAAPTQPPPPVQQPPQTALVPAGVDFGRYHALVIGNNTYRTLPNLKTAINDAEAIADLLRGSYDFEINSLTNATRSQILDALDRLQAKLTTTDNLLIYYAGHGWHDRKRGRGYWQPIDAHEDKRSTWVSTADITDTLKAVEARHVLVVADSCYSGALTLARSAPRGVKIEPRTPGFFARTHGKNSRNVLASGGLEPVVDSGGGSHSVFAKALLDALRDNRSILDGTQVFTKVREQVRLNSRQTPVYTDIQFAGHEVGGDFLFVRKR